MSDAASDTPVVEFRNVTKTFNPGTPNEVRALKGKGYHVMSGRVFRDYYGYKFEVRYRR